MSAYRKRRWWAIAIRVAVIPLWYPFAILAWVGERADGIFWWIEGVLPRPYTRVGPSPLDRDAS